MNVQKSPAAADAAITPRKRSKVSRACDECRRKKIRCDATLESGSERCSSCRRVGEKCSFSRIPMKRGPSKGYIKELEDRLNTLENSISSVDSPAVVGHTVHPSGNPLPPRRLSALAGDRSSSVPSTGRTGSFSSSGSPNSQYSNSYTMLYPPPRQRTDSTHSLPIPPGGQQQPQSSHLQQSMDNQLIEQRKRAFSSTMEFTNEPMRHVPSLRSPFTHSSMNSMNPSPAVHSERLPSIDTLTPGHAGSNNLLPPLNVSAGSATVVDEPAPPYMAPPNGPSHYWKPSYEVTNPAHQPGPGSASPRGSYTPGPPLPAMSSYPTHPPPPPPPPSQRLPMHRHSIDTGLISSYDRTGSSGGGLTGLPGSDFGQQRRVSANSSLFPFSWDDATIDTYYRQIHVVFPVLAHSRAKLRSRLISTSSPIRSACLHALYALVQSMTDPARGEQDRRRAMQYLADAQSETARLSFASSLLLVQTMILLALEAGMHGAAGLEGGMQSQSYWLASALGLARSLHLNAATKSTDLALLYPTTAQPTPSDDSDPDSDLRIARRSYLVIVLLDRLCATSLAMPVLIVIDSVRLTSDDLITLTPIPYHLLRLSTVLGHVSDVCATFVDDTSPGTRHQHLASQLRGELERVRESIDELWDTNRILEIMYFHTKLVTLRLVQIADPQILLGVAIRITSSWVSHVQQHRDQPGPSSPASQDHNNMTYGHQQSPLDHHFLVLSVGTLLDLTDIAETRDEAWRALNIVLDTLLYFSGEPGSDREKWESIVRRAIEVKRVRAGLALSAGSSGPGGPLALDVSASNGHSSIPPSSVAPNASSASSTTSSAGSSTTLTSASSSSAVAGDAPAQSGLERLAAIAVDESNISGSSSSGSSISGASTKGILVAETIKLRRVGYLSYLAY
ncbi:uncharacterized protein V1518DRAFT_425479 [Limtongia smithiae]|uniref:uncharacterized protein n=1 Tax=Limtongia smithiae TaxID=1125753 RepID=UPI0034CEE2DD